MLQREWAKFGRIRFGQFYARRFKRLTPALALMVAVTMLVSILVLSPFGPQQVAGQTAIGAMLLVANVVVDRTSGGYFNSPAESNPLLNTWSLSVEEQFYLVFPVILAIGWMAARRVRSLRFSPWIFVGFVAVVSFSISTLGSADFFPVRLDPLVGFYSPLTRAWEFAVGSLVLLASTRINIRSRHLALSAGLAGAIMLALCCFLITGSTPFPGLWTLLPVIATVLLIIAGDLGSNAVSKGLTIRPMVKIGDWSYSIYLWHWPFIVFTVVLFPDSAIAVVVAAAISFAPAIASYHCVEKPLRVFTPRSHPRFVGFVSVTFLLPVTLSGFLLIGASTSWWITWPAQSTSTQADHVAMSRGCTDQPFDPALCRWEADGSNGTVFLVGDSQAYSYADGVIEASALNGMSAVVSSRSGCPLSTLAATDADSFSCPSIQEQWLDYALETKPDVVVIANRSIGYTRPNLGWRMLIDEEGRNASTPSMALDAYERGLGGAVKALTQEGIGVVILQNIPEPERLKSNYSILNKLLPSEDPTSFDPVTTLANRKGAEEVESRVAAVNPGTVLYDPFPLLCPSVEELTGTCPLTKNGDSIYLDSWHLTRSGSLLLARSLAEAIHAAAGRR